MAIEPVVRPFADRNTQPLPFYPESARSVPPVRVTVGLRGGSHIFNWNASTTVATKMGNRQKERAPDSPSLQDALQEASNSG